MPAGKCVKTHDARVHGLVGSTNRERRGVAEADTTYADLSAVCVHKENSDDVCSVCTYSLTRGLCYAMHMRKNILLANICTEYARHSSVHLKYDLLLNILAIWYQQI